MAYFDEVIADAPIAYYRLGESAGTVMADASGQARDGSYVGSPTLGAPGLADSSDTAVTLAASQHGEVPLDTSWQPPATFTLEAIVKTADTGIMAAVAQYDSFYLAASDTSLTCSISLSGGSQVYASGGTGVPVGTVVHIAATYDGTTLRVYQDGSEVANKVASVTDSIKTPTNPLQLGTNAGIYQFIGTLDEVAVYNTVLTATRVTAHANAIVRTPPPPPTGTDTNNRANGLSLTGSGVDLSTYPVTATPPTLTVEPMRVVSLTTPDPTLQNGRPV